MFKEQTKNYTIQILQIASRAKKNTIGYFFSWLSLSESSAKAVFIIVILSFLDTCSIFIYLIGCLNICIKFTLKYSVQANKSYS